MDKTTEYAQGWDDHVLATKGQIEELQQQLADEKEKWEQCAMFLHEQERVSDQLRQQLDAERERKKN